MRITALFVVVLGLGCGDGHTRDYSGVKGCPAPRQGWPWPDNFSCDRGTEYVRDARVVTVSECARDARRRVPSTPVPLTNTHPARAMCPVFFTYDDVARDFPPL